MTTTFLDCKEQIAICLEDMFCKFGYTKYSMNRFEEYSFYMENEKFLDDSRVIVFNDPSGKLLALKPDITMSIIKNSLKSAEKNQKIYYNESVFRIPKGGSSYKEIKQIGVEFMGEIDDYQTIEILNLANKALAEISENYVLCITISTIPTAVANPDGGVLHLPAAPWWGYVDDLDHRDAATCAAHHTILSAPSADRTPHGGLCGVGCGACASAGC